MFDVDDTVADDDDDEDSGYFSDGELSSSQEIEVDDDFFFEHIMDDDEEEHVAHNLSSFATPKPKPTETANAIGDGTSFSQDSSFEILDNCKPSALGPKWKELSIADSLARQPREDDPHQIVMCRLNCNDCCVGALCLSLLAMKSLTITIAILSSGMILHSLPGSAHCCTMTPTRVCRQEHHIRMTT